VADREWTVEQMLELCDAASGLTPDQMRRQIAWLALMREGRVHEPGDIGCPGLDDF